MELNNQTQVSSVDPLLQRVQRGGWTERRARGFEQAYGRKLRWRIVVQMEKLGLLQHRVTPETVDRLSSRRLELYENTLSDLWGKLLGGLVEQYLQRVEEGKVRQAFVPYMSGVIRHLVIENARKLDLLGDESPGELLRSICEAKEERTRNGRLAWAKYCLEHRVRSELLSLCPSEAFSCVYRNLHHVSDYFFECYVPAQCEELSATWGNPLAELLRRFSEEGGELEQAAGYWGQVTPYARGETMRMESLQEEGEGYIAALAQAADQGWQ